MKTLSLLALAVGVAALQSPRLAAEPASRVLLKSEVKWQPLNQARGDKSPKAGTLWGDRKGSVPTGFLVEFEDGFSSPPHIHNVSYRGVVISGHVHNDDPGAADMWMPAGSFWTQPKGELHITAAKGSSNVAYIEIEEGPYLVRPPEQAFDSGERPVNVDAGNMVWMNASNLAWIKQTGIPSAAGGASVAFLWGSPQDDQLSGALVQLPAGFAGKISGHGSTFRAVVIKGQARYQVSETEVRMLAPGSYFGSKGASAHRVSAEGKEECILYIRSEGPFTVTAP